MSKAKCLPEYWFLDDGSDSAPFTLRQTGKTTKIRKHMLLCGRDQYWGNKAVGDWKLPIDAVRLLGSPGLPVTSSPPWSMAKRT